MNKTTKISSAIFDMDGLIFDNEKLYALSFEKAVGPELGIQLKRDDYIPYIGLDRHISEKVFSEKYNLPLSAWDKVREICFKWVNDYIEENGLEVKPGLLELLDWLKSRSIDYTIASSSPRDVLLKNLKSGSISEYFDHSKVISGDMVKHGKPNPEIFQLAASALGCDDTNKCIVFEDSYNGIKAANDGDFPCILVPDLLDPSVKGGITFLAKIPSLDKAIPILETLI